jgi:hypothetical protein
MKAYRAHSIAVLVLRVVVFHLSCLGAFASEWIEYEGELRTAFPSKEPVPLVRVVTKDGKLQIITYRDRQSQPNRIERLYFASPRTVTRYEKISGAVGLPIVSYDLTRDPTLSEEERERVVQLHELLVRHFYMFQQGLYRPIRTWNRPDWVFPVIQAIILIFCAAILIFGTRLIEKRGPEIAE